MSECTTQTVYLDPAVLTQFILIFALQYNASHEWLIIQKQVPIEHNMLK